MSTSIFKAEYECECGVDYGSCGAKCAVILKCNNACDVYTLYHTDGHEYLGNTLPKTTKGGLDCFEDKYLNALDAVIHMKESNGSTLTEEERKIVFDLPTQK